MKNIKLSFTLCHTTCIVLKFLHKYIIFLVFDHICVSKHEKRKMKSFFSSPSSLHYLSLVCTTHFYMCTFIAKSCWDKNTREWERWKSNKIHTRKSFFSLFFTTTSKPTSITFSFILCHHHIPVCVPFFFLTSYAWLIRYKSQLKPRQFCLSLIMKTNILAKLDFILYVYEVKGKNELA